MENDKISKPITILLGVWFVYLLFLGILQIFGQSYGFKVWPTNEDRSWLQYLLIAPGFKVMKFWWGTHNRCALCALHWFIVSPLINSWEWGVYLIRKVIDPTLAIIIFILLDRISYRRCRFFILTMSITVLMWNFSFYDAQLLWEPYFNLVLTLLSVFFYCRYIDNLRRNGLDLAISLILYFLAIVGYTLHAGLIVVIMLLSFFRASSLQIQNSFLLRIKQSALDSSLFLFILVIYLMLWYTAAADSAVYFQPEYLHVEKNLLRSICELFWPTYYSGLFKSIWETYPIRDFFITFITVLIGFHFISNKFFSKNTIGSKQDLPIGWILSILIAIALPMVLVESINSTWPPGSRSTMIQQVWHPIFFITLLFVFFNFINRCLGKRIKKIYWLTLSVIAGIFTFTILGNLFYNHKLVEITCYERTLAHGLLNISVPSGISPFFIVRTVPARQMVWGNVLDPAYAITIFKRSDVSISTLERYPVDKAWQVYFGSKIEGVRYIGAATASAIPYKNIWIVYYDGKKVWVPPVITKEDLAEFQVIWHRDFPIYQTEKS